MHKRIRSMAKNIKLTIFQAIVAIETQWLKNEREFIWYSFIIFSSSNIHYWYQKIKVRLWSLSINILKWSIDQIRKNTCENDYMNS